MSSIHKDVYVVRGRVAQVPDPQNPASEFQVHHEAIPHFRGSGGRLGMNVMTMPFPLAEGLSLAEVKVGDVIELTFEVDFDVENDRPVGYRATDVKPLPTDTELDFTPLPRNPDAAPKQPASD